MQPITFNVIVIIINFIVAFITISTRNGRLCLSTIMEFGIILITSGITIVLIDDSLDSSLIGKIMVISGVMGMSIMMLLVTVQ